MNGMDNLIPFDKLTEEEQRALAKKGGQASVKARKRKKNMKEALKLLLSLDVKSSKVREQLKALGIEEEDMNNEMALMVSMLNKALKGDKGCAEFIRDTSGQKPVEIQEVREVPKIVDDI